MQTDIFASDLIGVVWVSGTVKESAYVPGVIFARGPMFRLGRIYRPSNEDVAFIFEQVSNAIIIAVVVGAGFWLWQGYGRYLKFFGAVVLLLALWLTGLQGQFILRRLAATGAPTWAQYLFTVVGPLMVAGIVGGVMRVSHVAKYLHV